MQTKLILQVIYCKNKLVKQKELDTYIRNEIMHELLIGVNKKGKPAHGLMGEIAKKYDVHWKTVSRIWAKVKTQQNEGPHWMHVA